MKELGFIGYGNFGQFIIPHLKPFFNITVFDKRDVASLAKKNGLGWASLEEVAGKDIVVVGVPVQYLEELIKEIKDFVKPNALVMDVSSVKVKPIQLLLKYLHPNTEVIGIHPLFGPQSGKHGIKGLNVVVCPGRGRKFVRLMKFFSHNLQLNVLERTPVIHDKQMAYVQALTHFIGRAVNEMDIPDVEQKTPAYQYLLDIKRNLGQDSMELFFTIEKENPYAKDIRDQFVAELNKLNRKLEEY